MHMTMLCSRELVHIYMYAVEWGGEERGESCLVENRGRVKQKLGVSCWFLTTPKVSSLFNHNPDLIPRGSNNKMLL